MAKGKERRNHLGIHQTGGPHALSVAPQAAAHRRGGTHRVKDEHKTNTIYDEWDYKQLKSESLERQVYIKDMKKGMMAKALASYDAEKKRAERAAVLDRENKQRQQARENKREEEKRLKANAAKHERRVEKQARRDRDEDVSDDTPDEDELQMMHNELLGLDADGAEQGPVGQVLSEDSWDSTSSESTVRSEAPTVEPGCRLRLFQWPYIDLPSPTAPTSPISHSRYPDRRLGPERNPCKIPYIPLKIHTTESKEKLFLPGQTYPPGVDADYVPVLPQQTRNAARNGILEGVLRNAIIEPSSAWANCTCIQGWNARMFFSLPPRNTTKTLPDVYNKWYLENRRLLRVKPVGDGERMSRDKRHAQRHKNRARKLAEVLEASEHRLMAVCYLAAYLDFDNDKAVVERRQRKEKHTLENLFFIRFPDCDVPHYYFWARKGKGEWSDPTTPNPNWDPSNFEDEGDSKDEEEQTKHNGKHPKFAGKRLPDISRPAQQTFVRVKKPEILSSSSLIPDARSEVVCRVEHELYTSGLATVLSRCRMKWISNGREDTWKTFGRALPMLYPSGSLPSVPPVLANGNISIAMKIASIETSGTQTPPLPLEGNESWTRNDDEFWDIVDEQGNVVTVDGVIRLPHHPLDQVEPFAPADLEALYRRCSVQLPSQCNTPEFTAWLQQISPSFESLSASSLPPDFPAQQVEDQARKEWEAKFLGPEQKGMNVKCPFCLADLEGRSFQQQSEHMVSHSNIATRSQPRPQFIECPSLALPRPNASRRLDFSSNDEYFFDAGAEADTEKTPGPTATFKCRKTRSKRRMMAKRRVSECTFYPSDASTTHIPSPYLQVIKRFPTDHPNAAFNPRKRSISSADGLEFLEDFCTKKRKAVDVVVRVGATCPD